MSASGGSDGPKDSEEISSMNDKSSHEDGSESENGNGKNGGANTLSLGTSFLAVDTTVFQ